jgi:hypothetical protein
VEALILESNLWGLACDSENAKEGKPSLKRENLILKDDEAKFR